MTIEETIEKLDKLIAEEIEKLNADGCDGCAFESVEEWEMPCVKCSRICKDYWRGNHDK